MAAGEVVLMYRLEGDRGRKLKMIFVQNGLRIRHHLQHRETLDHPEVIGEITPEQAYDVVFAVMNIFLGGVIAAFLIFEPRGLMHRWNIVKRSYRMWPYPY